MGCTHDFCLTDTLEQVLDSDQCLLADFLDAVNFRVLCDQL